MRCNAVGVQSTLLELAVTHTKQGDHPSTMLLGYHHVHRALQTDWPTDCRSTQQGSDFTFINEQIYTNHIVNNQQRYIEQ